MGKVNNIPEGLKIFNTLTRDKAELTENEIGLYLCGPTVYDVSHIGHARSAYVFDVIVRYMRHKGKKVTLVRNVTDIDDKIINKAQSEIKNSAPGDTADVSQKSREVAERYLGSYHEDLDALGVVPPDFEPKATETIPDMIAFIELLIKKGYAYASDGSVYFDVRKFPEYGRLSGQSLDQMEEGARVALDKSKKDPLDFALWKASKENEPAWPSPWGSGRPGWHIECSVMSTKFLKNKFLIHGGGLDLVFPHHENEIAQTVCAGYKSAKYWLHNGLLTINSQKMSKSLGNYVTIQGFRDKFRDMDLLKLLFLASHYRHPVDYTEEKILEMKKSKERIDIFLNNSAAKLGEYEKKYGVKLVTNRSNPEAAAGLKDILVYRSEFEKAMDDDFNTPQAMAAVFDLINYANKIDMRLADKNEDDNAYRRIEYARDIINRLLPEIFGLSFTHEDRLTDAQQKNIQDRIDAKKRKDYKTADDIRAALAMENIILEDTKDGGTRWRRKL